MQAQQNEIVRKSDQLIDARYELPISCQKLIWYSVTKIDPEDENFHDIIITVKEIEDLFQTENPYRDLKQALDTLWDSELMELDENGEYTVIRRWIVTKHYYKNKSKIRFKFHDDLKPRLIKLNKDALMYNYRVLANFHNKYSIRIFDKILQEIDYTAPQGTIFVVDQEVDALRKILVLDEKYPKYSDLRRYVIEPVVNDINQSNLKLSYLPIKEGRTVKTLRFTVIV
jgi:plasmid replication initiation protein